MKPLWRSKTLWLNVIAAVLGVINAGEAVVPPDLLAGAAALANVGLRLVTHEAVSIV